MLVARDEVGLAVDLDQHADFAAGVDVRADEPFVGGALGLLLGLRLALFLQQRFGALVVALGLDQRVAAVDHAGAGVFAQALDVVGGGFVRRVHVVSAQAPAAAGSAAPSSAYCSS